MRRSENRSRVCIRCASTLLCTLMQSGGMAMSTQAECLKAMLTHRLGFQISRRLHLRRRNFIVAGASCTDT